MVGPARAREALRHDELRLHVSHGVGRSRVDEGERGTEQEQVSRRSKSQNSKSSRHRWSCVSVCGCFLPLFPFSSLDSTLSTFYYCSSNTFDPFFCTRDSSASPIRSSLQRRHRASSSTCFPNCRPLSLSMAHSISLKLAKKHCRFHLPSPPKQHTRHRGVAPSPGATNPAQESEYSIFQAFFTSL